ncbi:hypothetical protein [Leptolyngbya sp. FACHB-36]|uniref:hypothetical protein n=1 Tax=Leptolyngbya sp. FACHB-36 TaxID=2692808 RepID=UPI00168168C8|nr:hypothetical protein [Leptolyngbya sp. FACHB-36]
MFVKLHSQPVLEEETSIVLPVSAQRPLATSSTNLSLTIRFGRQEIKVPGGRVWFGLKRGELRLKLEDGKIPIEKMGLTAALELELEREDQQEQSREGEANIAIAGGVKTKDAAKRASKVKSKIHQVVTGGTEEAPVWRFEVKTSEPVLEGQLTEERLGTIEAATGPCGVAATFGVRGQRDICLIEAGGLWATDIGRNKKALLEREFFLRFIAPKLQPHLSRVEGQL